MNRGRPGRRDSSDVPWQGALWATVGLCLALFLALDATALGEKGEFRAAAVLSGTALILAGYIALRSVPLLARQVARGRLNLHIEYEITREGIAYLLVILVIAVASLNTGNNLLFLILAIMLAAIVGSGILSRMVLSGIGLEMSRPPHIFAGQPVTCRLKLQNTKKILPSYSLTVSSTRTPAPSWWRKSRNAGESRKILARPVYFPYLPKGSTLEQDVELCFSERGRYTQEGFAISSKFPFGFIRKRRKIETRQELLVLPEIAPIETFRALPPALAGEIQSFSRDDRGHDLYGLRDYRLPDSARNIDWKATARAQLVKVREFSREDDRLIRLVLDNRLPSLSTENLEKFERGVRLCASLAWHFAAQGAFLEFAAEGADIAVGHGGETLYPILEALATIEAEVEKASSQRRYVARGAHPSAAGWDIILTFQPASSPFVTDSGRSTVIPFDKI
ncbi:MAG TPA: DUF58 domain-containing protein [Terriglobia bacterium]|nr:DUF58 domain-containing protein [Terriglobia bacterium]